MADGSIASARDEIAQIVAAMLARRNVTSAVGAGADLRKAGLTSLDMVNLMLAVEDRFDLELPEAEMTPDNFRSIATIEALVRRLLGG
jgi:acyl carrier protein